MCNTKKYPLSLSGDTFNSFKSDFDQMLRQLLTEMEKRESEEATISIKMSVSLEQDQERDFEANGYDAMKDVTKPKFKHEISTVMQVKNKKSGSLGGNMKLVWDRELCQYVMQEIDNGQTSIFDGKEKEQEKAEVPMLASGDSAIDVDYEVVGDEESGDDSEPTDGEKDGSTGNTAVSETPFDVLKKFIGKHLKVVEAVGYYTIRTDDNVVIVSSGFAATDRFYASPEKLKPHVGQSVVCAYYGENDDDIRNISIECEDCDEVLFSIDAAEAEDGDYAYEDPDEQGEE